MTVIFTKNLLHSNKQNSCQPFKLSTFVQLMRIKTSLVHCLARFQCNCMKIDLLVNGKETAQSLSCKWLNRLTKHSNRLINQSLLL